MLPINNLTLLCILRCISDKIRNSSSLSTCRHRRAEIDPLKSWLSRCVPSLKDTQVSTILLPPVRPLPVIQPVSNIQEPKQKVNITCKHGTPKQYGQDTSAPDFVLEAPQVPLDVLTAPSIRMIPLILHEDATQRTTRQVSSTQLLTGLPKASGHEPRLRDKSKSQHRKLQR